MFYLFLGAYALVVLGAVALCFCEGLEGRFRAFLMVVLFLASQALLLGMVRASVDAHKGGSVRMGRTPPLCDRCHEQL